MRLIDADKLKEDMTKRQIEKRDLNASFFAVINEQPTVEAEPVRHGHWEYVDAPVFGNPYGSYKCDCCGNSMAHKTNYCPNCGAKMDEEDL